MIRTSTKGIFQSDILIRTAIMTGLEQLKTNPWMLDYIFAWLQNDDLTKADYGDKEIQDAKDWFNKTEIVVTMAYRHDRPQLPAIGIELVSSDEAGANSLGDVHYETTEDVDMTEVIIRPKPTLGPFTPKLYNSTTGLVTLPDTLSTGNLFSGDILYDSVLNRGYPIQEVNSDSTFSIATGVTADFTRAFVAPRSSFYIAKLESVEFQETYRLRCYVNTAPVHLTFLHSIIMFILLRNKQDLLEARGFERSTVRSQGIMLDQGNEGPELIYARDIIISGFVRQYWPKSITAKIDGIIVSPIKVIGGGTSPAGVEQQVIDQGWGMEHDQFGSK